MRMHRTTGKPDWELIPSADHNPFQKLAARTAGIITPANILTLAGVGAVIYGCILLLHDALWPGLLWIVAGRILDIMDGMVAEMTGTKSPIGELCDASADKLATLLTVLVLPAAGIVAWWTIVAIIWPQVLIGLIVVIKKWQSVGIHPTRQGKLSMAALWLSLMILIAAAAAHDSALIALSAYGVAAVSVVLGAYAAWQYARGND